MRGALRMALTLSQIIGKLPPLQGEDGGVCRERTHPHPNCPLASLSPSEGEGTVVQLAFTGW